MQRIVWVVALFAACGTKEAPIAIGDAAQPFGAVANVRLGMTVEEAKQAAPRLTFAEGPRGASASFYPKGSSYNLTFTDGKVSEIALHLFERKLDELTARWGPGMPAVTGRGEHLRYFTADKTVRADVYEPASKDSFAIRWKPMRPLADVLGAGSDAKLVTGVLVLGRPLAEVVTDLNKLGYQCKADEAQANATCTGVPAIEWSLGPWGALGLKASDGIVQGYHLHWSLDEVPSAKQAVLDAYKRKWGEPKDDRGYTVFGEDPRIEVFPVTHGAPLSVRLQGPPPAPPPPAP